MRWRRAAIGLALVGLSLGGGMVHAAPGKAKCRICAVPLKVGMVRSEVEAKLAASLGKESDYSPYGNNLQGGVVEYRDGPWTLRIDYARGTPAPWVKNPDGTVQHMQPHEESILKYRLLSKPK